MSFQYVNAWVFLNEDEPKNATCPNGVPYSDPSSCWQRLIAENVYRAVDILFIAFVEVVPTTTAGAIHVVDGHTLQNGDVGHPDGKTNADYMSMVVADARADNPDIRFVTTLDWGRSDQISQIFAGCDTGVERQAAADAFAQNAVAFFEHYGLHGFDIDWEGGLAAGTEQDQFNALCHGLRSRFGDDYLFTLSPARTALLTGAVVNPTVDFLNLQLYAPWVDRADYRAVGIDLDKLQYGATFESGGRQQTPQDVHDAAVAGGYTIITQWRLNSDNFEDEQDGQVALYQLCKG